MDDELVCFLPFVCTHIHLKGLYIFASLHKEGFCLVVLANLSEMASDLNLVGTYLISRLVLYEVDGAVPVASGQGGLDSLVKYTSLDKVIHSLIELALGNKPVTPLFFESDHVVRERLLGKVNCLFEGVAHNEGIESSVKQAHFFKKVSSLLMHI